MTRQHVTVALNGDGGDESLAGYPRYQAMKFMAYWRHVPAALRRSLLNVLRALPDRPPPYSKLWRMKRLLSLGLDDVNTEYLDAICFFQERQKVGLYSEFLKHAAGRPSTPEYL